MSRFAPVPSAAVDDERLSNLDLLVLMALGYHTDAAGWCWPSQSTIAKKARLNRTTVTACIKTLIKLGYVELYRPENGDLSKTRYRVIMDTARAPEAIVTQPVAPLVATDDKPLVADTDKLAVRADKACRPGRHKQEPTNYSKEQDPALAGLFEEIWSAWSRKLKAGGTPGRGDGKAKVFELFRRKAAKTDPALIRTMALAHISKAKLGFLEGLSVWLNGERYDTGENVVAMRPTLSAEDKRYAFETFGRWDPDWGPKPTNRQTEGALL